MAIIIDGKSVGQQIKESLKMKVTEIEKRYGAAPGLAVVLVGADPASSVYVQMKGNGCQDIGIKSYQHFLPEHTTESEILKLIHTLNNDDKVSGILVQFPLPPHIRQLSVINAIDPHKDVDGFHPFNTGKMLNDHDCLLPCTPLGIRELISRYGGNIKGKHLVVVGRSSIVGKPLANMMLQKKQTANCIVTVCHSAATDISIYTKQADILVVAAGQPKIVTGKMVKQGVIVIDVGVNRINDIDNPGTTRLVGDVDFDSVAPKAHAITPVPGGVGPMTIAMLLSNTIKAFELQKNN